LFFESACLIVQTLKYQLAVDFGMAPNLTSFLLGLSSYLFCKPGCGNQRTLRVPLVVGLIRYRCLQTAYLGTQEFDLAPGIFVFGRQLGECGHNFRPIESAKPDPKAGLAAFTWL
jgi:hypothetical protein